MKFDLFFNLNKNYMSYLGQRHYFHMVTPSPWPFLVSIQVFVMLIGAVSYMHFYRNGGYVLLWGVFNIIFIVCLWLRDVIREGTYEGMHTSKMQKNLKFGFILFIVTEVMFFFAFFWAFFHSSLSPAVEIGGVWPPIGITVINPWKLPFLNTCLLLQSGIYITICHIYIRIRDYINVFEFYILTLIFGVLFTFIQIYEYINASFSISDGIYGSTFYMLTGFHGFHVLAGTVFIFVCLQRTIYGHFTANHHVGFECAAWYWHFVDVVWLFLFIFVYVWGAWII
jgi:heme/copper-type cytochrome/quinol oxidase subunit 3